MIQKFYNKLSEKEKKVFHIAIAMVTLAFFDMLFLRPVLSRMRSLDEEIKQKENVVKRDLRFLSYKERILKENIAFNNYFINQEQTEEEIIAGFLKTVEMIATDASVNLIKLNPSESKKKKGYIEYYADLECAGELKNVIRFMHLIDSTENLLKVVKMSIVSKAAGTDEVLAVMTLIKIIVDSTSIEEDQQILASEEQLAQMKFAQKSKTQSTSVQENVNAEGTQNAGQMGKSDQVGMDGTIINNDLEKTATGQNLTATAENLTGEEASAEGAAQPGAGSSGGAGGSTGTTGQAATAGEKKSTNGQTNAGGGSAGGGGEGADDGQVQTEKDSNQATQDIAEDSSTKKENKLNIPEKNSGRVQIKGIESLWSEFWGNIFPKKEPRKLSEEEIRKMREEEQKEKEEPPKKNLWERMLVPK